MNSNKGFATVFLLSLTPLLLAFCLGFWGFCQILFIKQSFDDLCRSSVLKIQKENAEPMHQLMRLNPLANSLIRQKKRAYKRLAFGMMSKNPLIVAKAKAKLAELQLRQLKLSQAQSLLAARARSASSSQTYLFQQRYFSLIRQKRKNHLSFLEVNHQSLKLPDHRWAVRATHPQELASPYEHQAFFAKAQTIKLQWKFSLRPLQFLSTAKALSMEGECRATLLEQKKYPVTLVADRY